MRALTMLLLLSLHSRAALALPPGRAWAAPEVVAGPAIRMADAQIGFAGDSLVLVTALVTRNEQGPSARWTVLVWSDSVWRPGGPSSVPAQAGLEPLAGYGARTLAAFVTHDPRDPAQSPLLVADVRAGGLGRADTALRTTSQGTGFGCALSARRRWVVRSQQKTPRVPRFVVRTAFSDTAGLWHELPARGEDEASCAVAALDESRALVVYAGESGLRWAVAQGAAWGDSGALDVRPRQARNPRLSRGSGSAVWLLWTENSGARVARFEAGRWSAPESLTCAHPPGEEFWSSWTAMSGDGGAPALAWGDRGVGATHRDVLCVSVPGASAWPSAEEVPGSNGAAVPTLARDANGDVWVAWEGHGGGQLRFVHSYVAVTCMPPALARSGDGIRVSWRLDAPAPGSRWTVLRSIDGGSFAAVATRAAGNGTAMEWTDASVPPGSTVAYRIRRDSLDARYGWSSPPGTATRGD